MAKILGVPPSPYVRKVILAHKLKEVEFELTPVMPGSDDVEFRQASPFGKIPGYITDDGVGFADSSVIVAYLEKKHAHKPLYPQDANRYAKALWFEEYADTKLMDATAGLYFQRIVGPLFFSHQTDDERCNELIEKLIPEQLDFLEQHLEGEYFVGNSFSIADLSIGINLMSLLHADFQITESVWPKLAEFNKRFLALPEVIAQIELEKGIFNQG